ncbi:MAG: hypothetical protein C0501_05835 [Isosphaera sp.]|nr:hypothetical protein [Isosphaera sp.]
MNGPDPPADGPTGSYAPPGTFPDGRPLPDAPTPPYLPADPAADAPPPSARFRPHTLHKEGGMGRVHRAADGELNREVAFKDIKPKYADSDAARQRFIFEAEVTGRLEHPGIVPVYGFGRCPAGRPYYGMRFIDGQTLGEAAAAFHAAAGPATVDRALALRRLLTRFVSVCQTVAFAHSRGVIHRDLKPANVMLGPFGETLVMDWGVAKRLRAGEGEAEAAAPTADPTGDPAGVTRSAPGSLFGTPGYWSPEQAAGRPDLHDERTDVYGLGAVLFHLLTGRAPNPGGVIPPDPPSPRADRAWVDEVLDAITRRALARAREDRYPSAAAVAVEVERWLADQPVAAQRAVVAALVAAVKSQPGDYRLTEQLARQQANLGLMLGGMGRDADAVAELTAAILLFARLAADRGRPRFRADEANCYLALARCLAALGRPEDAHAANVKAAELYRGLVAARPDEFPEGLATAMLTLAAPLRPSGASAPAPDTPAPATTPVETRTADPDPNVTLDELPVPADPNKTVVPDTAPVGRPAPDSADPAETAVPGYTLLREVGRGGLGSVWLARDEALGRRVAVKVLAHGFATGGAAERFAREARVTAGLEHPNIIRVYAAGRRADGGQYLVMEYLTGTTLLEAIGARGTGPNRTLLRALAQVCDGLHYAHGRGVVHRDAKPANVMLVRNGRVVLLDWGVARVVGQPDGDDADDRLPPDRDDGMDTASGGVVGTPAYMAPEQARGDQAAVGPRTDVYVVGAGLFHLLTGRTPIDARGGVAEALGRLIQGGIPRPRDVRPDVPPALDAICAKAMAFRPGDRYPSAAALAADLRAYLAGRPVSALPRRGLWGWLTGRR